MSSKFKIGDRVRIDKYIALHEIRDKVGTIMESGSAVGGIATVFVMVDNVPMISRPNKWWYLNEFSLTLLSDVVLIFPSI